MLISPSSSKTLFTKGKKHHTRAVFRIISFISLFGMAYLVKIIKPNDNSSNTTTIESPSNLQHQVRGGHHSKRLHRYLLVIDDLKIGNVTFQQIYEALFENGNTATTSSQVDQPPSEFGKPSYSNGALNETVSDNVFNDTAGSAAATTMSVVATEASAKITTATATTEATTTEETTIRAALTETEATTITTAATTTTNSCNKKVAEPKSMLILYIIGVLYMFIAIALVCDELFVPALEVIASEKFFNLSPDVTGATLMAAGGSAPELFTSIIGTFKQSEIGFGTIVGSAVFNVLFVIAMCAFFSREVLQLSWWPLLRDCTWYSFALLTLAVFCGYSSPGKIEIWEAVVQFLIYICYVIFMYYNAAVYEWLQSKIQCKEVVVNTHNNRQGGTVHFRNGLYKLLLGQETIMDKVKNGLVVQMYGDVDTVFTAIDKNRDGFIEKDELRTILASWNCKATEEELTSIMAEIINPELDDKISISSFKEWYICSEYGIKQDVKKLFNEYDLNRNGVIDANEFKLLLTKLESLSRKEPSDEGMQNAFKEMTTSDGEEDDKKAISFEQFQDWYFKSPFVNGQDAREAREGDACNEDDETISSSLGFPDRESSSILDYIRWAIVFPIMFCLSFTVPDVRARGKEKWCFLSFFLSICWIGLITFFMVEWTSIIGNTLGIPELIMGLTFLAAGTSVPDLLSSVIVARMGEGDMAVSSSIGSNIFDITFGLPIPWLLYGIVEAAKSRPAYVIIGTAGMSVSILILFAMVIIVILIIHFSGWKLLKSTGVFMIVLYVVYLIQAIVRELPFTTCA